MARAVPSRDAVIDAVALAFASSDAVGSLGPSTLKSLVSRVYDKMVEGGALDLYPIWDVLQDQPGFSWEAGVAPCCAIKTWQDRLGVDVLLPPHMDDLGDDDIRARAAQCAVPDKELEALFEAADAAPRATPAPVAAKPAAPPAEAPAKVAGGRSWGKRKEIGIAAVVLSVAAVAFMIYTVAGYFGTPEWSAFRAGEIDGDIPIASAEIMGAQVGIELADDGWLAKPRDEIRAQMETALRSLDGRDVEVIFVRDRSGRARVSAQWFEARIETRFLP